MRALISFSSIKHIEHRCGRAKGSYERQNSACTITAASRLARPNDAQAASVKIAQVLQSRCLLTRPSCRLLGARAGRQGSRLRRQEAIGTASLSTMPFKPCARLITHCSNIWPSTRVPKVTESKRCLNKSLWELILMEDTMILIKNAFLYCKIMCLQVGAVILTPKSICIFVQQFARANSSVPER